APRAGAAELSQSPCLIVLCFSSLSASCFVQERLEQIYRHAAMRMIKKDIILKSCFCYSVFLVHTFSQCAAMLDLLLSLVNL
uniref:Uncharacterized protein n=1 Tax=Oryza brachyantha TaxID=4533 RepID=J3L3A9_ORYBR